MAFLNRGKIKSRGFGNYWPDFSRDASCLVGGWESNSLHSSRYNPFLKGGVGGTCVKCVWEREREWVSEREIKREREREREMGVWEGKSETNRCGFPLWRNLITSDNHVRRLRYIDLQFFLSSKSCLGRISISILIGIKQQQQQL